MNSMLVFGSIITDITSAIGDWITSSIGWVLDVISGMVPIFYDKTADGGGLTVIGVLALFGLAVGLVRLGMNFVRSFFVR